MRLKQLMLGAVVGCAFALSAAGTAQAADGQFQFKRNTSAAGAYAEGDGGEFAVTVFTGVDVPVQVAPVKLDDGLFQTFCAEKSGIIMENVLYDYTVSTSIEGYANGAFTSTPLPPEIAYLYTRFHRGVLSNYNYATLGLDADERGDDARQLNRAMWALTGELAVNQLSGQELTWYNEAKTAVSTGAWSGIGDVRVLNIRTRDGKNRQDALIVLEPDFVAGESCCENGKLVELRLRYTGEGPGATSHSQDTDKVTVTGDPKLDPDVYVIASAEKDLNKGKIMFEGDVTLNQDFLVKSANAGENTFKSETWIYVYAAKGGSLIQTIRFHTSCSQPLFSGDQFGSMIITGCRGEDAPPPGAGPSCCEYGKPVVLTFQYTGDGNDATTHSQDADKVSVTGDPLDDSSVYIIANNKDKPTEGKIWFSGTVGIFETFDVDAGNANEDKLESETYIYVYADSTKAKLLQTIKFHTSCSQPLFHNDQFGSALLVDCIGENSPPPGSGPSCCDDGKPALLVMEYTGDGNDATVHGQDSDKVSVTGDPKDAASVYIIANNKSNPSDGKIWFTGTVALGKTYNIDAANANEDDLESETWIHIYSDSNKTTLLQTIKFHTSCSQPLFRNNQFGSAKIVGCRGKDATTSGNGISCCDDGKPIVLRMKYTGDGNDATSNSQDTSKVTVTGDPNNDANVYIIANDDSDATSGKVWFAGSVDLNATYDIDARLAGASRLGSETYIHVYASQGGTLLQTIRFHTSCSQPLFLEDQFGSAQLVGCFTENDPNLPALPQNANPLLCQTLGKPIVITMTFTGDDDDVVVTGQDSGKYSVSGDIGGDEDVYIVSNDSSSPTSGNIWFSGRVLKGQTYDIDAGNASEDKLSNATFIHVFASQGGTLLQSIEFHTSCSQPIRLNDQYGSAQITGYVGVNSPVVTGTASAKMTDLCVLGKPAALKFALTGNDDSNLVTAQKMKKVKVEDHPTLGLPSSGNVYVVANSKDKADKGYVWFKGTVAVDGTFEIKASNASKDKLKKETYIHIYDKEGGTLLQTIRFHTSCSQPIRLDDEYGAVKLTGFTPYKKN